jgi:hypothetical protein
MSNIDILSGFSWIKYGLKPQCNALVDYLKKRGIDNNYLFNHKSGVKVLVGGNSVGSDVWLGLNLKKYYEKLGLGEKVRVDTFLYNRFKKRLKVNIDGHNHYNISSLCELSGLIKENKYLVDFVDFDGTLVDFCLGRSEDLKLRSRLMVPEMKSESLDKLIGFFSLGPRCSYAGTIYLGDVFFSMLKFKPRFEWCEKDNSLKDFLESIHCLPTQLVISSFSCYGGILNAIKDCKAKVSINKPIYY